MLSQAQRTVILELNTQQVSKREIARVLGVSRVAVRKVLRSNSNAVPELHRTEKAEPHRQQCYPNFRRFDCKVFLTEALRFMGGVTTRVMIDNTHVVVLRGSGRDMVPVPEMAAFGERFGFQFVAHAIGNANRSGGGTALSFHRA